MGSFHSVTSGIPKWPGLLNINTLEKMTNSKVINLLNDPGQLKVNLPTENCFHGDYTWQELVKSFVDKCKVKDNSNWEGTRISAKFFCSQGRDLAVVANNFLKTMPWWLMAVKRGYVEFKIVGKETQSEREHHKARVLTSWISHTKLSSSLRKKQGSSAWKRHLGGMKTREFYQIRKDTTGSEQRLTSHYFSC